MKKSLMTAVALSSLFLGVSVASSEILLQTDPQTGNKIVVNTETEQEMSVTEYDGTAGAMPAECPEGTFILGKDPTDDTKEVATSCDDESSYVLGDVTPDTMAAQGYPEGTRILTKNPVDDTKEIRTQENAGEQLPGESTTPN